MCYLQNTGSSCEKIQLYIKPNALVYCFIQCLHRVVGRAEDGYQRQRPEYNILCLGLQGAGKSTLLAKLAGESTENIEETKGTGGGE